MTRNEIGQWEREIRPMGGAGLGEVDTQRARGGSPVYNRRKREGGKEKERKDERASERGGIEGKSRVQVNDVVIQRLLLRKTHRVDEKECVVNRPYVDWPAAYRFHGTSQTVVIISSHHFHGSVSEHLCQAVLFSVFEKPRRSFPVQIGERVDYVPLLLVIWIEISRRCRCCCHRRSSFFFAAIFLSIFSLGEVEVRVCVRVCDEGGAEGGCFAKREVGVELR